VCKLLLLRERERERERETILGGRIQQRIIYHFRTMRREYEEEEHEEEKHDDGDAVVVLLPLISPRPPLLFICLPFLTTFNNFLVNFPSANGDAIAQTGFCFSSSPSPPLLADDGIGNPSRSRFEDLLFGVSFFSFLAFFALFSPLEPILNVCLMCCGAAK